jgi:hypothetical protein
MNDGIKLDLSSAVQRSLQFLVQELGSERLIQLASLIREVEESTQYGDVKIIIAQGEIQRLKAEKSY